MTALAGPDLVAVIKAMAEFWRDLACIDLFGRMAEREPDVIHSAEDPTDAEFYEAKVRELRDKIGELQIGDET